MNTCTLKNIYLIIHSQTEILKKEFSDTETRVHCEKKNT